MPLGDQLLCLPAFLRSVCLRSCMPASLQFLTFHDYLLRNFNLFRLESTYEIRQDIEDAIIRLDPRFVCVYMCVRLCLSVCLSVCACACVCAHMRAADCVPSI